MTRVYFTDACKNETMMVSWKVTLFRDRCKVDAWEGRGREGRGRGKGRYDLPIRSVSMHHAL